jgi:2,6-dihydroxypyridine 3-monooxygenase
MNRAGRIVSSTPAFWWSSAYNVLYRGLLGCFDRTRYHLGEECVGFEQDESGVTVRFATGRVERGDLAVFADGINSIGRRLLLPECRPRYAGYVAWRGTVSEENLKPETFGLFHEAITYHVLGQGHALAYPIPNRDGTAEPGRRLTNWLWYRNVDAVRAGRPAGGSGRPALSPPRFRPVSSPRGTSQKLHADARELAFRRPSRRSLA